MHKRDRHVSNHHEIGVYTADLGNIASVAAKIVTELRSLDQFCLYLIGGLGAGKTTFTGALLRALGLDPHFPVTSPTFTYLNEYQINGRWYAHIDLYRAGAGFSLEELGFVDSRRFAGYFIEWPSALDDTEGVLPATHQLEISPGGHADERVFRFLKA
jgi:tRNA threonylcarbamoyl adenosine modification protein YjeE